MKSFVVVPTYNESRNIGRLIEEILETARASGLNDLSILVVDDHSPDGTSALVSGLAASDPRVHLAERVNDKGRGTAGIVGFDLALKLGAEAVIEMDADFSHPPREIPRLLDTLARADIAIASRLAPGARDLRPLRRRAITWLANRYARGWLALPSHRSRVRDWTTGFRAYRRAVFERVPVSALISRGPSILQEILFRALNQGLTAAEIPFEMKDREAGQSTFSSKVARQSLMSIPAYRILFGGTAAKRVPQGGPAFPPEFRLDGYSVSQPHSRHFQLRLP